MYLTQNPTYLIVDGSNNIITDSINVLRQNSNILVNDDRYYSSMNNSSNVNHFTMVKNTKVGDRTIEKTEALIYEMPTSAAYENLYIRKYSVQSSVKNQIDEIVTTDNVLDVIKLSNETSKQEKNNLSNQEDKNKKVSMK